MAPASHAPVAGHLYEHDGVEEAARAEVLEEVGLCVLALIPVTVRWRANIWRRQHDPLGPGHTWTVFRADVTGTVGASPDEAIDAWWLARGRPSREDIDADHWAVRRRVRRRAGVWQRSPGWPSCVPPGR